MRVWLRHWWQWSPHQEVAQARLAASGRRRESQPASAVSARPPLVACAACPAAWLQRLPRSWLAFDPGFAGRPSPCRSLRGDTAGGCCRIWASAGFMDALETKKQPA